MENLKSYFNFSRQTLALLGVLFLVVIGIAATVLVAQQQQEIRKRAGGGFNGTVKLTRTPDSDYVTLGQKITLSVNVDYSENIPYAINLFADSTPIGGKTCNESNCQSETTYTPSTEIGNKVGDQITFRTMVTSLGGMGNGDKVDDKNIFSAIISSAIADSEVVFYCTSPKEEVDRTNIPYCGDSASTIIKIVAAAPPPPPENNCLKAGYHECEFGKVVSECKKGVNTCNVYDTWQCSFGGKNYCGDPGPNPLNCSDPCVPPGTPDTTPPPSCIDITPDVNKCNITLGCQWYTGKIGAEPDPDPSKHFCSKVSDSCVGVTKDDCTDKVGDKCTWDGRGFCRARQKAGDFSTQPPPPQQGGPPDKGGSPVPGTDQITPIPSKSCRVSWAFDPNPETSPANTSFRAYIKGESSQNSKGDPDWGYVKLKFDNGNLAAITDDIRTSGTMPPLPGLCSEAQPCFKSNVLNSGAVNSTHTLTFSINNPEQPRNPNGVPVNCTPAKPFETAGGGIGGGGAKLLPALNLEGFTGTYTPKRDTEALTVLLRSQGGTLTAVETVATFSASHRHFRKLIDLPADLPDGIYELLLKGASTLRRTFGNVTITKNRETFVPFDPAKPLLSCDLNNDNLVNMLDLNQLYTDIKKPKAEHKDSLADITRDGVIDIFDHNYCVQNFLKEGEKP